MSTSASRKHSFYQKRGPKIVFLNFWFFFEQFESFAKGTLDLFFENKQIWVIWVIFENLVFGDFAHSGTPICGQTASWIQKLDSEVENNPRVSSNFSRKPAFLRGGGVEPSIIIASKPPPLPVQIRRNQGGVYWVVWEAPNFGAPPEVWCQYLRFQHNYS
jgi:hypothetical protein